MSEASAEAADAPGPKRRRLLDAGGPVEDDETARRKMRGAHVGNYFEGFDPDNVSDIKQLAGWGGDSFKVTPMGCFAMEGDLPMMRWLYVNGADTRDRNIPQWFPMFGAVEYGHLDACKWLFEHGAAEDISRRTCPGGLGPSDKSPLQVANMVSETHFRYIELSRWLILNGALCRDDGSGTLDVAVLEKDLTTNRFIVGAWANELHQTRNSFLTFMGGTFARPKHAYSTRMGKRSSLLHALDGKSGVLELVSEYAGVVKGREARIIRQLAEILCNDD